MLIVLLASCGPQCDCYDPLIHGQGADADADADTDMDTDTDCDTDLDTDGESSDYDLLIQPIWTVNCVACHGGDQPVRNLDLSVGHSHEAMVGVTAEQVDMPLVAPGSADDSYVWHKLQDTQGSLGDETGVAMPDKIPALDDDELKLIGSWIREGAEP